MFEFSSTKKKNSSGTAVKNNSTKGSLSFINEKSDKQTLSKLVQTKGVSDKKDSSSLSEIINSGHIQPKLILGKPNDAYEQEADQMAEKVVNSPKTDSRNEIKRQEEKKEPVQAKVQFQEEEKEEPVQTKVQLQEEEKKEPAQGKVQLQEEEKKEPVQSKDEEKKEEPVQSKEEENKEQPQAKIQLYNEEKKEPVQAKIHLKEERKDPIPRKIHAKIEKLEGKEIDQKKNGKFIIKSRKSNVIKLDVGHAFFSLVNKIGEKITRGFYPTDKIPKLILGPMLLEGTTVPGKIKDDSNTDSSGSLEVNIDNAQYENASKFTEETADNPPNYNLYQFNCVHFLKSVAKKININIPELPGIADPDDILLMIKLSKETQGTKKDKKNIQRSPGKNDETQLKHNFNEGKTIQAKNSGTLNHADIDYQLKNSKGSGSPLPSETRSTMESGFGTDFSGVRIHTNSTATQMSKSLNAQAFTHGNDIYFNEGKYNPNSSSGKNLIAHELTHTIQQGASVQKKTNEAKTTHVSNRPEIQRSWLGDAWDAVSDVASSAVDFVSQGLEAGLNWIKDRFKDFVQGIPGYTLLTVVLGQDPIKGTPVVRNGRNFIEAGLDVIPFGNSFKRKLEEVGALAEAATWLDGQIARLDISLSSILSDISAFWNSLSITDIGSPTAVLERAANIIRRPVGQVITFAGNVAAEFLRIVKRFVVNELSLFIKNHTRGYPLLTVILGKDPITEENVERNGMNLIRGFMLLSADGEEQLRQMQETGSLQRAADWIDTTVAELDLSWAMIRNLFTQAWDLITITNLMTPIDTFQRLVGLFAAPVGRIIRFVIKVGLKILEFIKKALLSRLSRFARESRGYPLITVILGKDPFTEEPVPRNAENMIHGFMSLMDGGEEQFQQMKESGAIRRTTEWIEGAVARLGFTWEYIKGLFITAWNSLSLRDLAAPLEAFVRIVRLFAPPVLRLVEFVWEVIKKVIEILLIIMRFPFDLVNNIITKAMQAINDIKRDPIGFLKNILRAIKLGFTNFFSNILSHLLFGVSSWLFSELRDVGVTPPRDFTLRSILGFVLEVLGITMDRIWRKLAEKIGQERVDAIRNNIERLEGIWTFIKDVVTRGPAAIWEYVVEKLSNLWDTVLEAVRNWVITKIVEKVVTKLLSMLDPTGIMAVVNSVIAIYRAIESFIRYLRQMLEIVNSFVEGVAEIAKGNITKAAEFVENAMHRAMPVIIGFLANQVGLSGIGRKIGEMIEKVREKVDAAIGWLIDKAISAGTAFLNMLRRGAAAVRGGISRLLEWWKKEKRFTDKVNKSHKLFYRGTGRSSQLMLESNIQNVNIFLDNAKIEGNTDQNRLIEDAKIKFRETEDEKDIMITKQDQLTGLNANDPVAARLRSEINTHDTNLTTKFNSLSDILMKLNIDNPITELIPSKISKSGDSPPTFVESTPLTEIPGEYRGSSPGEDPPDWIICNYINNSSLTPKGRASIQWVRMHLLNDHLHGPGVAWNLTPGRQETNDAMKRGGEQTAKEALRKKDKKLYSYKTIIGYWGAKPIQGLSDPNDPTSAEVTLGDEKNFPKSVTIEFGEATKNDGGFTSSRSTVTSIPDIKPPDPNEMDPSAIFSRIEDKVKAKVRANPNGLWIETVYDSLSLARIYTRFNMTEDQKTKLQKIHNPTDLDFRKLLTLVAISKTPVPTTNNIMANSSAALSTIQAHVSELAEHGYVASRRDGRTFIYSLLNPGTAAVDAFNKR